MFKLFSAVPAVGAELFGVDADGGEHIVQPVVAQGGELVLCADAVHHLPVLFAVGVCVFLNDLLGNVAALKLADNAA